MRRVPGTLVVTMLVGAALVAVAGCSSPTAPGSLMVASALPARAGTSAEPAAGFIRAINDFGADLLRTTAKDAKGNVIVSPVSVHAALSMTANGATGETASQMRDVLGVASMSAQAANEQWATLLLALDRRSDEQSLEAANGMWASKDVAFKEPFLDADRDYFGAELATLDFDNGDVPGAINAWVGKNTHGMITEMIDRVPAGAILYLANAVYFKGTWEEPFRHESTRPAPFTRADGSKVDVDMMRSAGRLSYTENATLQAARLPYVGGDSAFYVFLPRRGVGTDAAVASLAEGGFARVRGAMTATPETLVLLGLPKLDADFSADLNKPLARMGMPRAFDVLAAEFTGIADLGVPIYISDVRHKTKVKVDEEGTEAAAATTVEMTFGSAMSDDVPPEMVCDRPYLFAIVDEPSGAVLFLGVVNDPTK